MFKCITCVFAEKNIGIYEYTARIKFNTKCEYYLTEDSQVIAEGGKILGTFTSKDINKSDIEEIGSLGFYELGYHKYVSSQNFRIKGSDSFPPSSVYYADKEWNDRWVPVWYFEAIEKWDRDIIVQNEPKRLEWDGDAFPTEWYFDIPHVASLFLSNVGFIFYSPVMDRNAGFAFETVKKESETVFVATACPGIEDTNERISWEPNKENVPALQNGNPVKFRFEINGKEMKIYNGETGKLCLDLIQMPAEWTVLYEDFVIKNTIPAGLYLPEEYLKRKNGGSLEGDVPAMEYVEPVASENQGMEESANAPATEHAEPSEEAAIPKPAPDMGKAALVTENLRLRTDDTATAEVVTTLAARTRVKVLASGREDTIDGIASNWTQVRVLGGAKDKDGNAIEAGTKGWLFGGYLSETESAESESANEEASTAKESSALPIVPIAVG
ncbi:MAG: SH3 domain-containing protein, partial [Treponemataceae bacterium]|nr:SH3 domain-containing protein [Treponemataceae bacterium]